MTEEVKKQQAELQQQQELPLEKLEKSKKKSRRGNPKYKKNPFIKEAVENTTVGQKRISSSNGERLMIVGEETGEIKAPAGFHHIVEIDKTQFIKVFKNGVKAFANLSNAGARVFSILYDEMQNNINKDVVFLNFSVIDQEKEKISSATFYRGMNELIDSKFIAESEATNLYFVNPAFIWNGNRLAFIKEYRVVGTTDDMFKENAIESEAKNWVLFF